MQNSMYYTNSGLTSLPSYQGGGYLDQYGRQRYGFGKFVSKITKPIAKVLDKVVPNEIKPALPFIAALAPLTGIFGTVAGSMPGFGLTGPALEFAQRGLLGAALSAGSQLSQEGAAERGINPLSLGLSGITAGLSGAQAGQFLEGFRPTIGGEANLGTFDTLLSKGVTGLQKGAEFLSAGREDDLFSVPFAKAAVAPTLQAAGEVAYNAALDAQKKYQDEMLAMGNLASANKQDQINYIRRAMVSAGFNEDEISSAISRSGFAGGGRVAYGMGSIVKPAMRGLKGMKNKIVDFISKMTDDIEIRTQTDYADDSGASFDIYITPKTERGKNTLDQISQMGLAEKFNDGRYFINDINLEEATMSLNERGIKASGVYEPTAKGEQFESFRTAGQGPYGADYYGYDRLKEGLRGPKRPPMDEVDYDTIPSPTDKPEGFADGGLMNLRMGGMPAEMDLRKGGFVPLGKKERADDVPARLSKNEFVFTAKAVRNAGGGDIRKGAKRMYQIMNQLEARA